MSATQVARELSPGAYPGISFEEYAAWDAVNWHRLKPFDVSAKQGRHEMTLPQDATDAMVLGGAFHAAILEPEKFAATYAVMPRFEGHPNSNAYKAQKQVWAEANADKVQITTAEMLSLKAMHKAVMAHPVASALLSGRGRNELSICWRDAESGELCKGRVDRLCRVPANVVDPRASGDLICLVDLKKTSQLHRFDGEVAKYGYHGQLAFYKAGLESLDPSEVTPLIVAVQDDAPFDVVVFNPADAIEDGAKMFRRLMRTYQRARKEDYWPGLCPTGTLPVILPKWAKEAEDSL